MLRAAAQLLRHAEQASNVSMLVRKRVQCRRILIRHGILMVIP